MKLFKIFKQKKILKNDDLSAGDKAGQLYDNGHNCAQAVLQATCPDASDEMVKMAEVFGGGIDDSKCLCGAVTGATMSLSLQGKGDKASRLVDAFKGQYITTCCKGLTAPYRWLSKEHIESCQKMTANTADLVVKLLEE